MPTFNQVSKKIAKDFYKLVALAYKKQRERLQRILVESKLRQEIREDFL